MKCTACKKEVNLMTNKITGNDNAEWYGRYLNDVLVTVICYDCIQDPIKKASYINDKV